MKTRIIGLDPGTFHAGYGVIDVDEKGTLRKVVSGCVHAPSDGEVATRLATIYRGLRGIMENYRPHKAAVESVFAGKNVHTALIIGEARGIALLSASVDDIPVVSYEPRVVKKTIAGSGSATKEQIQRMMSVILCLSTPVETDHESDALALAIVHALREKAGVAATTSGPQRRKRRVLPAYVAAQLAGNTKRK